MDLAFLLAALATARVLVALAEKLAHVAERVGEEGVHALAGQFRLLFADRLEHVAVLLQAFVADAGGALPAQLEGG